MSEYPWTGGKWEARPDTESSGYRRGNWVVVSEESNPVGCYEVADCWGRDDEYTGAKADAKLIALAPEMAEAILELKRLARVEEERTKDTSYIGYTTVKILRIQKKLQEIQDDGPTLPEADAPPT